MLRSAAATASRTAESADYVLRTVRGQPMSESDIAEPAVSTRLSSFISRSRYSVARKTAHYHSCFLIIVIMVALCNIYISLFVCKHSTNTYIHKIRLLIREGKKSNTREKKRRKKTKKIKTLQNGIPNIKDVQPSMIIHTNT